MMEDPNFSVGKAVHALSTHRNSISEDARKIKAFGLEKVVSDVHNVKNPPISTKVTQYVLNQLKNKRFTILSL